MEKLRKSINNPLDQRNFFVLFVVLYLIIFPSFLAIETIQASSALCNNANIHVSEEIEAGSGKSFEFVYQGENACELTIFPSSNSSEISVWVYKPDKTVQPLNAKDLSKGLLITGNDHGNYRVSMHNQGNSNAKLDLYLTSLPN